MFKKSFSSSYVTSYIYQHLEENSYRHVDSIFDKPGENSVASSPKQLCSNSEKNENLLNFQKFFFNLKMILWRHRVQFSILIPLPRTFSPSTVIVRSKFWRFWKKKRFFKSLIFCLILWDEDCNFQFWYPCRNLFCQAR